MAVRRSVLNIYSRRIYVISFILFFSFVCALEAIYLSAFNLQQTFSLEENRLTHACVNDDVFIKFSCVSIRDYIQKMIIFKRRN